MIFGKIASVPQPVVVVGGNCSIQGFDAAGAEVFWTVTGDNVSALAWCDVDEDGNKEVLIFISKFQNFSCLSARKIMVSESFQANVLSLMSLKLMSFHSWLLFAALLMAML